MKIFLDTANVTELREGVAMGLVDGCTTNPSLIAKEKRPFRPLVEEICSIVAPGDVSLEVVATDFDGMVKEGKELAQVAPNAVVKCPLTKDGLKAVKHLSSEGIRVNQTLCFSATQALLSAKAGATYISPFLGRLDDIAAVGMDFVPSKNPFALHVEDVEAARSELESRGVSFLRDTLDSGVCYMAPFEDGALLKVGLPPIDRIAVPSPWMSYTPVARLLTVAVSLSHSTPPVWKIVPELVGATPGWIDTSPL